MPLFKFDYLTVYCSVSTDSNSIIILSGMKLAGIEAMQKWSAGLIEKCQKAGRDEY